MGEPTRSILGRSLEKSGLSSVLPSQQTWCTLMFHGGATAFAKSPKKLINSLLVFHCRVQVLNKSVIYMGFMMKKTRNWSQLIVGWGDINQQKKRGMAPPCFKCHPLDVAPRSLRHSLLIWARDIPWQKPCLNLQRIYCGLDLISNKDLYHPLPFGSDDIGV